MNSILKKSISGSSKLNELKASKDVTDELRTEKYYSKYQKQLHAFIEQMKVILGQYIDVKKLENNLDYIKNQRRSTTGQATNAFEFIDLKIGTLTLPFDELNIKFKHRYFRKAIIGAGVGLGVNKTIKPRTMTDSLFPSAFMIDYILRRIQKNEDGKPSESYSTEDPIEITLREDKQGTKELYSINETVKSDFSEVPTDFAKHWSDMDSDETIETEEKSEGERLSGVTSNLVLSVESLVRITGNEDIVVINKHFEFMYGDARAFGITCQFKNPDICIRLINKAYIKMEEALHTDIYNFTILFPMPDVSQTTEEKAKNPLENRNLAFEAIIKSDLDVKFATTDNRLNEMTATVQNFIDSQAVNFSKSQAEMKKQHEEAYKKQNDENQSMLDKILKSVRENSK